MRAAVAQEQATRNLKFVALGVPAEVVMIIEDQDARARARLLAIEVGCRQTTDTAPHHYKIVGFASAFRIGSSAPESFVPQLVRDLEGTGVVPSHGRQRGRVVTRILGRDALRQQRILRR